jgi:hypothetical protein
MKRTMAADTPDPDADAAFLNMRTLARAHGLRLDKDEEGYGFIPGEFGRVEYHDGVDLAVWCDRPRLFPKLRAIPNVRPHQVGDEEMRALFPVEALDQVASVIRAKRARRGQRQFNAIPRRHR